MPRDHMAPFRRSPVFWLGVTTGFVCALALVYVVMEPGLGRVDSEFFHYAMPDYVGEFVRRVAGPGYLWGLAVLAVASLAAGILTRRRVLTLLIALLVSAVALGAGVWVVAQRSFWPRYERIMVEAYIVDPPCLGACLHYPISMYLGAEDREWAVPLALSVGRRPVGDNRWGAAYTLLR